MMRDIDRDHDKEHYEYFVHSKWVGWWGGFGSENDIADILEVGNKNGWRLIRTDVATFMWFFFLPRRKLLLIFERPAIAAPVATTTAAATAATPPLVPTDAIDGPFTR